MGRESNIDSIRALEEQIKEHERAVIKLKRARNSLLDVSSLPPEVLGDIFCWNVTLKDDFGGLEKGSHNFLFVCHHWFEVASRTTEIWTFWGNNIRDWDERYLRSSVAAPLDLVLDGLTYMFGYISESQQMALKDRAARDTLRRVHLQSDRHDLLTSVIDPLLSPYGGLRTNSLESLILDNEDFEGIVDASFVVCSHLSKLRCLKLVGCKISSWDYVMPQTTLLTTLKLTLDDTSPAPAMHQLLSMLGSNPHLQKLELNSPAIPENGDDDDGGGGGGRGPYQVQLHHLEQLRLGGVVGRVLELLRRLEHPRKLRELFVGLSHCAVTDISQRIGPYLQDYLQRRGRSRDGLGLWFSSKSDIALHVGDAGSFYPSTSLSARMTSFVSIVVDLDQALPDDRLGELGLDLIAYTPREEAVYFRACGSSEVLKDLPLRFPNLKTLDLCRAPLSAAFPILEQDGHRVLERFPPSLQHLSLERPHLGVHSWVPLLTFLSCRASSGNHLDSLLIEGRCHMCSRVAQLIKRMVRKFKVDGECLRSWCPFDECL